MAIKKSLGMGLDLLLTAADNGKDESQHEISLTRARAVFHRATEEDEQGNLFEAYHLYRQVMDLVENPISRDLPELCALVSQSFNNAAIILYDADRADLARTFLHKAIKVCPDNQTARENLQTIS